MESKREAEMKRLIGKLEGLPSLPEVVYRVMDMLQDPDSTVAELVEALLTDQAMTAKILRLANSPYYGFVRKIETVTQAVAVLGKNDIGDHVLGTAVYGFLGLQGPNLFDRRAFWEYSLACAQAARILLRLSGQPAENVYISALIHEIGQLVIDEFYPDLHDHIISQAQDNQLPIEEVERRVLGFDHTEVGGLLTEAWNFPSLLVDVVRSHHSPVEDLEPGSRTRQIRTIIDLSDRIVRGEEIGDNCDRSSPEIPEEMWFPLGLNSSHHIKVANSLHEAMEKLASTMSL